MTRLIRSGPSDQVPATADYCQEGVPNTKCIGSVAVTNSRWPFRINP